MQIQFEEQVKKPYRMEYISSLREEKDYEGKNTNLITPQSFKYPSRWRIFLTRMCKTYTYKIELWPYKPTGCDF